MAKAKEPVITVSTVFAGRQTDRQAFIDLIIQKNEIVKSQLSLDAGRAAGIFQDDGYTGLNMERPDFQKMLAAVERKMFDVVLTKDLSRLGRNYLQVGQLLEDFFPRQKVRYIALNDAVDSEVENEITPFRSLLNEMYSRDVSKKVHSSYLTKAKSGKFTGCLAPFGYRKDPERGRFIWDFTAIQGILANPVYIGAINEWIKEILIGAINGNLSTMFGDKPRPQSVGFVVLVWWR